MLDAGGVEVDTKRRKPKEAICNLNFLPIKGHTKHVWPRISSC